MHKTTDLRCEMGHFLFLFPHTTSMDDNHHRRHPTPQGRGGISFLASVQTGITPMDLGLCRQQKSPNIRGLGWVHARYTPRHITT